MRGRLIACATAGLLAAGLAAEAVGDDELDRWRRQALELTNQSRAAEGLGRLELGDALNQAAQAHAADMLRRRFYSHVSPEGGTPKDRFLAAGGSQWPLVAENIARCAGCRPTAETLRSLHEGWMDSPSHRENLMHRGVDRFGFGFAADGRGGLYAVQTFSGAGTPLGLGDGEDPGRLRPDEVAERIAQLLNQARAEAGVPPLRVSPVLGQAAGALLPDPAAEEDDLQPGDIFRSVAAAERRRWSGISFVASTCGGCGAEPTLADLRYFRGRWLQNPTYKGRLMAAGVTDAGFAMQTTGTGRKIAVLVIGTRR